MQYMMPPRLSLGELTRSVVLDKVMSLPVPSRTKLPQISKKKGSLPPLQRRSLFSVEQRQASVQELRCLARTIERDSANDIEDAYGAYLQTEVAPIVPEKMVCQSCDQRALKDKFASTAISFR